MDLLRQKNTEYDEKQKYNIMKNRIDLLTQEQISWCNEHCDFEWLVKDDGKVYAKYNYIYFKDEYSIVSFSVDFGDCRDFDCSYCESLKSLKGASKKVNGYFDCSHCKSLESLEGAPDKMSGNFCCSNCRSLKSLEGAPKKIGGYFDCDICESLKFIDGLKNIKIKGKIYHQYCPKLKKYDFILGDMNMFRMWQKSTCSADEFMKEYSGFIEAKKYGI